MRHFLGTVSGYDEHDGDTGNEDALKFTDPNPVDIFGMARRSAAFMEKCQKANKSFFLQLSWHALHAPENALKATTDKYAKLGVRNPPLAAITEDLDTGVGMIYMSDNGGGGGGRRAFAGGKGDLYEGGIRIPFIVRGPGVKPGSWSQTRIVGYDLYPTFCE